MKNSNIITAKRPAGLSEAKADMIDTIIELTRECMYDIALTKRKPTMCFNQFFIRMKREQMDVFEAIIENNPALARQEVYDMLAQIAIDVVELHENHADFSASAFCSQPIPHYSTL